MQDYLTTITLESKYVHLEHPLYYYWINIKNWLWCYCYVDWIANGDDDIAIYLYRRGRMLSNPLFFSLPPPVEVFVCSAVTEHRRNILAQYLLLLFFTWSTGFIIFFLGKIPLVHLLHKSRYFIRTFVQSETNIISLCRRQTSVTVWNDQTIYITFLNKY